MTDEELDEMLKEEKEKMPIGQTSPHLAYVQIKEKAEESNKTKRKRNRVLKPVLIGACTLASLCLCFYGGWEARKATQTGEDIVNNVTESYLNLVRHYFGHNYYPITVHSSCLDNISGSKMMVDYFYGYDAENTPIIAYIAVKYETLQIDSLKFEVNGSAVEVNSPEKDGTGSFPAGCGAVKIHAENSFKGTLYSQDDFELNLTQYDEYIEYMNNR